MALSKITNDSLENTAVHGVRNLIINGAMQVAQRGTSHTYSNGQSGYHTLDRFFSTAFVSGGTLAVSQQSVSLSDNIEAEFFLRATTTGSVAAGSATVYSETRVENLKFFHNKTLTLSFYAKADAALTFQVRTYKNYGSGGSAQEYSGFSDISVTNSWTKYTLTFSAEDLSSKTFGTSSFFGLLFYWSTGQGSNQLNDNSIDITLVQLEVGDTATPFEHRSYGKELALCQRYCYFLVNLSSGSTGDNFVFLGRGNSNSSLRVPLMTAVPLRASPTIYNLGGLGYRLKRGDSGSIVGDTTNSMTVQFFSPDSNHLCGVVSISGATDNKVFGLTPLSSTQWYLDSEL